MWGTESAWRIPLNELFDAQVIVFWEHVLILVMLLPLLLSRLADLTENRRAHLGLSHFLRIRRLGRRHHFFYAVAEVRKSHRRQRHPEHPTGHLHAGRVRLVWRSPDSALLPLRRHRHSRGNFSVSRTSHTHRRIFRESGIEFGNRLRAGVRVILGTLHRGRSRHDDRNAFATRRQSARGCWADLHDVHSARLRKIERRVALAAGRASAHDYRYRRLCSSRYDLRAEFRS